MRTVDLEKQFLPLLGGYFNLKRAKKVDNEHAST
jgi:hypothetical protein